MGAEHAVRISREVDAPVDVVWEVLSDGWLYPLWVVGAARMRNIDHGWPAVGTRLHHSVGNWPFLLDDKTEVLEVQEPRMLRLKTHGWPAGAAEVILDVEDLGANRSRISIREDATDGPGSLVPKPARQMGIGPRNRETMRRLALLVEGRAEGR